jgi:hypothetical protein
MAATRGKLYGRITVPTGGWATTVGAGTATITAGTYYADTFLTEVATRFATASGTTCTVTVAAGETGTGIVTITFGVAKAIAWGETKVRDILGFAGDSASATVHTGTKHMRHVWLPNCHYVAPNAVSATWRGWREADARYNENAAGYVWAFMGQEKEVNGLRWPAVSRAKTWIGNETTANESFERFCRDSIWGVAVGGTPGGPLRFYPDADAGTYATYMAVDVRTIQPQQYFQGWAAGPWTIELPRLVVVPGT